MSTRRKSNWDLYGDWLSDRVKTHKKRYKYTNLMQKLHYTEFMWKNKYDENRASDGLDLRDEYPGFLPPAQPCSCLEMLVGLAIRVDNDYLWEGGNPKPELIFWEMLRNLKLDEYHDIRYDPIKVDKIVNNWLFRRYDFDGRGGIFPNIGTDRDQRKLEIWDQMIEYVSKRYMI